MLSAHGTTTTNLNPSNFQSRLLPINQLRFRARNQSHHHHWRRSSPLCCCTAVLSPDLVFNITTLGVMPFYAMMIASPHKPSTQRLMTSHAPYYFAAALYAALFLIWSPLAQLWSIFKTAALTGGLPNITAFATTFSAPETTTLAWLHLVMLDLFQARLVNFFFLYIICILSVYGPYNTNTHIATE